MGKTTIEWCDYTFNPWIGCTKVSEGCRNCYAETLNRRYKWCTTGTMSSAGGIDIIPAWGRVVPRKRTAAANWKKPLEWNKLASRQLICPRCGIISMPLPDGSWEGAENCVECEIQNIPFRPKVFCASLADWLDPEAPDVWRADLLKLIHITPHLDWLLLSKRPENFALLAHRAWACGGPADFGDWMGRWLKGDAPDNVWVGATVENQDNEKRITDLLNIPARVRFLSCEPLLGPVDISPYTHANPLYKLAPERPAINWVICGGETGPNPRPMHPDWARSLRDQCKHAGVPFFFKQNGEYIHESQIRPGFRESPSYMCEMRLRGPIHEWNDGTISAKCGRKAAGHLLDGVEHNEFPEVK